MATRVLLVDDHVLLRDTLRERLEREPSISVVGAVGTADEALDFVGRREVDVIVMDIDMPGQICFDAARSVIACRPETRVIFLSAHTHDGYVEQALKVGALGYLTKTESPEKVVAAIQAAMRDHGSFSEDIQARLVVDDQGVRLRGSATSRASTLTARETQTVRYIARGLSKKEIAGLMHVSEATVAKHTENLMRKLDIHDRVELARFAIREGLATL